MSLISRLIWDKKNYETGVDRGVLYPKNESGIAWNGLISIQETPSSDERVRYIDGVPTRLRGRDDFSGTIQAFTYPEPFPDVFDLSYRVQDKIHVVYNVRLSPTSITYQQQDIDPFAWSFSTLPVPIVGRNPSAHLVIDGNKAYSWTMTTIEAILYGSEFESSRLPSPEEILSIFDSNSILQVVDNGDGTFTVTAPDDILQMVDDTTFQINWPSAIYIDEVSYTLSSL